MNGHKLPYMKKTRKKKQVCCAAWEWWEFRWSNKWNWYSSGLNTSILVWHTCASALSGWVLYRQLELTKLTRPDLHHVVGLFILKDVRPSVCLSVRPSVTPVSLCFCHRIIIKFSGVITIDKSDVHAKGQGQRSKVKVTEVKTQFVHFRTVTQIGIHWWLPNDA